MRQVHHPPVQTAAGKGLSGPLKDHWVGLPTMYAYVLYINSTYVGNQSTLVQIFNDNEFSLHLLTNITHNSLYNLLEYQTHLIPPNLSFIYCTIS